MSPKNVETMYDAVIIGAGAAGLSAALGFARSEAAADLAARGIEPKVLVISKLQPLRSHTGSAEGGIAASLGNIEPDEWQWHFYDTVKGGDYLVDQDAAEILAKDAPMTVINLERSGVAFSRTEDGHIAQRRFGGHTRDCGAGPMERAAYAADRIGHQILTTLWQQCVAYRIEFAEEWYVTDLVLDEGRERCLGVVAFDTHAGTVHALRARNVILATGGAGRLFHTTSNSYDLTGDGMALALNAGLQLEDSEFIQFHPTGLGHTGILLSEASRAEGGVLRNAQGEAFMRRYAPDHGDLAARDVVSRAIRSETEAGRGVADPKDPQGPKDCVWLDMTAIDPARIHEALPQVEETARVYGGVDPAKEWIAVKPTAHYTMGGIPIGLDGNAYWMDGDGRHMVEGLYAAGECSCVSVHGANRLGGNSLLEACLFGTRAGQSVAMRVYEDPVGAREEPCEGETAPDDALSQAAAARKAMIDGLLAPAGEDAEPGAEPDPSPNPYRIMARLGEIMDANLAVRCDAASIQKAREAIETELDPAAAALRTTMDSAAYNQQITAIMEARNLLTLAKAVLDASMARHESRGSLARRDYPERDDEHFLKHSMTGIDGVQAWEPVHPGPLKPERRSY